MRMRVLTTKLRVEIENEMRVFLESLNFEIEMRVSQKSVSKSKYPSARVKWFVVPLLSLWIVICYPMGVRMEKKSCVVLLQ